MVPFKLTSRLTKGPRLRAQTATQAWAQVQAELVMVLDEGLVPVVADLALAWDSVEHRARPHPERVQVLT